MAEYNYCGCEVIIAKTVFLRTDEMGAFCCATVCSDVRVRESFPVHPLSSSILSARAKPKHGLCGTYGGLEIIKGASLRRLSTIHCFDSLNSYTIICSTDVPLYPNQVPHPNKPQSTTRFAKCVPSPSSSPAPPPSPRNKPNPYFRSSAAKSIPGYPTTAACPTTAARPKPTK